MREIKFRGKRTQNNEWVYGYYMEFMSEYGDDHPLNIHNHVIWPLRHDGGPPDDGDIMASVIPETVGQYTNHNDKHSKEIFDSDRVKVWTKDKEGYAWDGTVIWNAVGWDIKFDNDRFPFNSELYIWAGNCEIIGNIHDNPEVLQ